MDEFEARDSRANRPNEAQSAADTDEIRQLLLGISLGFLSGLAIALLILLLIYRAGNIWPVSAIKSSFGMQFSLQAVMLSNNAARMA